MGMAVELTNALDAQIGQYVSTLLKERGLKRRTFALQQGIDDGHFRRLLNGTARWNTSLITAVAHGLHVPPEQIVAGRDLNIPPPCPSIVVEQVPRFRTFAHEFSFDHYIPIRLLGGEAAAGAPSEVREDDVEGWVLIYASREWMPGDPENYTAVHVRGLSMWPILGDGDIVAIDHSQRDPQRLDKKMVVFRSNGGVTIKWLRYLPEKGVVMGVPENKDELDAVVVLRGEEINTGIVGRVAWWWAKRA